MRLADASAATSVLCDLKEVLIHVRIEPTGNTRTAWMASSLTQRPVTASSPGLDRSVQPQVEGLTSSPLGRWFDDAPRFAQLQFLCEFVADLGRPLALSRLPVRSSRPP